MLVAPDGVGEVVTRFAAPAIAPSHYSVLLRALGRAYYWQHLLDSGAVPDTVVVAQREGIIRSTVSEVLRLALSPDIVEAAVVGRMLGTVSLERLLLATLPRNWGEQGEVVAEMG